MSVMSEEENKLIRAEFQRMLDKLIDSKIRPTATEIISVEQPLISLFEEVMYKLEKQQKEIEEKSTIIMAGAEKVKQLEEEIEVLKEDLDKKVKALDIAMSNPDYICKDKIREKLKKYDKDIAWANADDHYYFVKYINELLEENDE